MVASRFCFAQAQDRMLPSVFAETSGRKVPLAALLLIAGLASLFLLQSVFAGWAMGVAVRSLAVLGMWLALAVGALNLHWHKGYRKTDWGRGVKQQKLVVPTAIVSIILAVPLIVSLADPAEHGADLPAAVPGCGGAGDRGGDPRRRERQGEEPRRELPLDRRDPAGRIEAFVIARETPGGSTPGSPPLTGTVSSLQSWVKSGSGGYQSKIVLD